MNIFNKKNKKIYYLVKLAQAILSRDECRQSSSDRWKKLKLSWKPPPPFDAFPLLLLLHLHPCLLSAIERRAWRLEPYMFDNLISWSNSWILTFLTICDLIRIGRIWIIHCISCLRLTSLWRCRSLLLLSLLRRSPPHQHLLVPFLLWFPSITYLGSVSYIGEGFPAWSYACLR